MIYIDHDDLASPVAPLPALFASELRFERGVGADRRLSLFRRNAATWELMLLLAASSQRARLGIYEVVDLLQSKALGQSALLKFIRDRRDDGLLIMSRQAERRNKFEVGLDPTMLARFSALLDARNRDLQCNVYDPALKAR